MQAAELLFTDEARRHVQRLARAVAPSASRLGRRFTAILRQRGFGVAECRTLLAITPLAAASFNSIDRFLAHVEQEGEYLARCNVPLAAVHDGLRRFNSVLESELAGRHAPSREQLNLATLLALDRAYYQVRELEAQALFGISQAENEAAGPDHLLRRLVAILTRTLGARAGRLLVAPGRLEGPLRRPIYIARGTPRENLLAEGLRGHWTCYWSYPLEGSAVVQFGFSAARRWLPRELALLAAAAERCREALDRARLETEVQRLESAARYTEQEERRRIGRELHDEASQSLLLLRLQLEMIGREAPEPLRPRLHEASDLVVHTVEELRRIIAALSPAVLERIGFRPALRQLASNFRKLHPARLRVRITGPVQHLPGSVQQIVYRATQECLNNIAKHSQAETVNFSLVAADSYIKLTVSDNGSGFPGSAALKAGSFGLAGMRERALLAGGNLTVRSQPGCGTVIVLKLPLHAAMVT
jgi:signal transduction histidine kinase